MFDRYEDLDTDARQLAASEPPSHAHALELLRRKGIRALRVVHTSPEAILYLDRNEQPWTAWCQREQGGLTRIGRERGFAATPGYLEPDIPRSGRSARGCGPYDQDDQDPA